MPLTLGYMFYEEKEDCGAAFRGVLETNLNQETIVQEAQVGQ